MQEKCRRIFSGECMVRQRLQRAEYKEIFGEGNFFLELQDHGMEEQKLVNQSLLRMSQETGIELVATNDIHYTYADDVKPHDILLCIQTGKKLADEDRMRYEGGQYYIKSEEEMRKLFPYAQEAIDNTQKIADRCNVEIVFGEKKLPKYDVPDGFTSWEYLNKLCYEGLERRYPGDDPKIRERLEYELGVIKRMGYVDYFLIVWDFIKYARDHGISVGPGRGSAAGSIVSYCLGITSIDPLRYQLLFERFLNPERVSMPDIDVDFCFERRQEVIDYVVRKYGTDRVVQIVTFGTMAARGVIRDVGRVMDLPYAFVDGIAKMIPKELNITLEKALQSSPDFKKAYENDRAGKRADRYVHASGRTSETYIHACSRRRDQSESSRRIRAAFGRLGWFGCHTVYNDNAGRAGTSENGFPRSPDADCYSGCSAAWQKRVPAKRLTSMRLIITIKKYWITSEAARQMVYSSWKVRGMKEVHEGTETTESGRHYRRYLAVPSGTDGFHSTVY